MPDPPTGPPANVSVAIGRPDDGSILVLRGGVLPAFALDARSPWQVVSPVNDEMLDRVGVTVTTLRAAWLSSSVLERLYEAVWLGGELPAGSAWTSLGDLGEVLSKSAQTSLSLHSAILDGALTPAVGNLQPWYLPGWLDGMVAWIDDRLMDTGLRRTGPVRQIRSWGRSALFRLETDRGPVWAKEVPAGFAHEIAVTGLLADLDPGLVPPLIAADPASGRLLMSHVAGPLLCDVSEPAAWTATLARLGETQRVLATERGRLAVAGVAAEPLTTLADEIPALLADEELLRVGLDGGISEAAADGLAAHADQLTQACLGLAASGVPDSLDHGDLSPAQVIVGEMGPVMLDWSDASVTHPYLSLASFLSEPSGLPIGVHDEVIETYLRSWAGVADVGEAPDARDVYRLATMVAPLHLARLFRDRILPGLEQPWEMERAVPRVLGVLAGRLASEEPAR
jgi:hypothetical protein